MGTEQGTLSSPSTTEDENGGGNLLPFVSTFHDKYIPFLSVFNRTCLKCKLGDVQLRRA